MQKWPFLRTTLVPLTDSTMQSTIIRLARGCHGHRWQLSSQSWTMLRLWWGQIWSHIWRALVKVYTSQRLSFQCLVNTLLRHHWRLSFLRFQNVGKARLRHRRITGQCNCSLLSVTLISFRLIVKLFAGSGWTRYNEEVGGRIEEWK